MTPPSTSSANDEDLWLSVQQLDPRSFAPYGEVLAAGARSETVNQGTSVKYPNLCRLDVDPGAQPALHIFRPEPVTLPARLRLLERHPLSSQVFMPLGEARFLVVVASELPATDAPSDRGKRLRAFASDGHQGVKLARGIWHHPLLALDSADFLVIDRYCPTPEEAALNLEEYEIGTWNCLVSLDSRENAEAPDDGHDEEQL